VEEIFKRSSLKKGERASKEGKVKKGRTKKKMVECILDGISKGGASTRGD